MNRRWIPNDTPCRREPDGDAGFEVEVVDASSHDELVDKALDMVRAIATLQDEIKLLKQQKAAR